MSTQQTDTGGTQALPTITSATYQAVCKMMEKEGIKLEGNQQISEYVQKLVARESFFRVVDTIQERNQDIDPGEIETAVDEAVAEVREERRKQDPSADRS